MEESLCHVEFLKSPKSFIARVESDLGGMREHENASLENVLKAVFEDLMEEFDSIVQ